jgi:hypothetical protein
VLIAAFDATVLGWCEAAHDIAALMQGDAQDRDVALQMLADALRASLSRPIRMDGYQPALSVLVGHAASWGAFASGQALLDGALTAAGVLVAGSDV